MLTFNKTDKTRDRFRELFLYQSNRRRLNHCFKKILLAVSPAGYANSLIFSASCVALEKSIVSTTSLVSVINDQIMEHELVN